MSEAPNAAPAAAPAEAPASTSLLGEAAPAAAAPAAPAGEQPASSGAGEGEAAPAAGQGASSETPAAVGGAPAAVDPPAAPEGEAAQGAPEAYAAFEVPTGYALEGPWLDQVTGYAKAHNFTQDQAQALVSLGVQQSQAIIAQVAQEAGENPVFAKDVWTQRWSEATRADKDIGGDSLKSTVALANRVFQTFADKDGNFAGFLRQNGLDNHPEMLRFMRNVGRAVSEDVLVTPTGGGAQHARGDGNVAKRLYPKMN
jgi:hypothetical protein